ncbi:hypothetical protein X798_03514, partial [Onchocerca flexuosa]
MLLSPLLSLILLAYQPVLTKRKREEEAEKRMCFDVSLPAVAPERFNKRIFQFNTRFPKVIKLETARISDGNTDVWKHNGIYNQLALLEQAVQKNLESAFNNGVMAANS